MTPTTGHTFGEKPNVSITKANTFNSVSLQL
jgi:hypothetical protein